MMLRRHFLTGLVLLAAPWSSASAQELLRGWFWLRWEAWREEDAYLEYSALQAAHGPLMIPAFLRPIPTLNARPRAVGKLAAPVRWGKGPCLVCEGPGWPQMPRVIWLEARDGGLAYRVEAGGAWAEATRTLPAPEFAEKDFLPDNIGRLRAVLKANQEEAGAFTSDAAGEMLDPKFRGKIAVVIAPVAWTRAHFSRLQGREARIISFLEFRFR